ELASRIRSVAILNTACRRDLRAWARCAAGAAAGGAAPLRITRRAARHRLLAAHSALGTLPDWRASEQDSHRYLGSIRPRPNILTTEDTSERRHDHLRSIRRARIDISQS